MRRSVRPVGLYKSVDVFNLRHSWPADVDAVGRPSGATISKGAVSSARSVDYDSWGRVTTSRLDGLPVATLTYDPAERVTAVSYPSGAGNRGNGTTGAFVYSTQTGLNDKVTWSQADTTLMTSDEVSGRWLTNRIRNQAVDGVDVNGGVDNYAYDGAWRLTSATTPNTGGSRSTSYGFADVSSGCPATGAGRNSNRTSKVTVINGGAPTVVGYCYDHADRLVSTTDAAAGQADMGNGSLSYDDHGNTTRLGSQTMTYDVANRHLRTSAPVVSGKDVLLVVGNPAALSSRDNWLKNQLVGLGWSVTVGDDNVVTTASASGKRLVVLSESVSQAGVSTKFTSVKVPVITAEAWLTDELGMTGAGSNQGATTGGVETQVSVTATGAGHLLGAGFAAGNVTVASPGVDVGWGKPNSDAIVAATVAGDGSKATVYGYETGTDMVSGTAPARRASWLHYTSNANNLNANAVSLFAAVVSWASATQVAYTRDATDSIVERNVNGETVARYSGPFTLDGSNTVTDITVALPGGAVLRYNPGDYAGSWTYPNLAGHNVATADSVGVKQGATTFYDPDGMLAGGSLPDTHPGSFDNTWHGAGDVKLETETGLQSVIEMGARQYHVGLGRFLEVDPIEGGVHNDYGHVTDPVNRADTTGLRTEAEKRYCLNPLNWFTCRNLWAISNMFHDFFGTTDNDPANARKHLVLTAFLYFEFGDTGAVDCLNRHEAEGCGRGGSNAEKQDCHNNSVGLAWARELERSGYRPRGGSRGSQMRDLHQRSTRAFISVCNSNSPGRVGAPMSRFGGAWCK